jgi:hypothetical protein
VDFCKHPLYFRLGIKEIASPKPISGFFGTQLGDTYDIFPDPGTTSPLFPSIHPNKRSTVACLFGDCGCNQQGGIQGDFAPSARYSPRCFGTSALQQETDS